MNKAVNTAAGKNLCIIHLPHNDHISAQHACRNKDMLFSLINTKPVGIGRDVTCRTFEHTAAGTEHNRWNVTCEHLAFCSRAYFIVGCKGLCLKTVTKCVLGKSWRSHAAVRVLSLTIKKEVILWRRKT